jgi:hypothetical protein
VGAGANQWNAVPDVTSATLASRSGSASATARASGSGARRASASIGVEKSIPTAFHPRARSAAVTNPVPQPTSAACRPPGVPVRAAIAA